MTNNTYPFPVNQLLTIGGCGRSAIETWRDYQKDFELTAEHIPELVRLLLDQSLWYADSDSPDVWASTHAWRALAQLGAMQVVEPLLSLLADYDDDDYLQEEAPLVFALLGPEVLPRIEPHLKDPTFSMQGKIALTESLAQIGLQYPETQGTCSDLIQQQLENYKTNDEGLNGWLVEALVQFKVVEAAPLIEAVYANGNIDQMCAGPWPRVQVDLGLKQESDFHPDQLIPEFVREMRKNLALDQQMNNLIDGLLPKGPTKTAMTTKMTSTMFQPPTSQPRTNQPYKFGETDLTFSNASGIEKKQGFGSQSTGSQSTGSQATGSQATGSRSTKAKQKKKNKKKKR